MKKISIGMLFFFLIVLSLNQIAAQSGIDPNTADIDAQVTEESIRYINFNKWTEKQVAQIQPTVLECCLSPDQARQFYAGKIPLNGYYKPSTDPVIFSREALFYSKMMGLTSNYLDLTVGKGVNKKGDVFFGAELGWDSIKFGDKVVKLPNRLGNLYGITSSPRKEPILLRQNMKNQLEVEGMTLRNGNEVTVTAALSDWGEVVFPKGSSFEGKGFSASDLVDTLKITGIQPCNFGANACVQLTTQTETASRDEPNKVSGKNGCSSATPCEANTAGPQPNDDPWEDDGLEGDEEPKEDSIDDEGGDGGGEKKPFELPKTVIQIVPGKKNYNLLIVDGSYDRIQVVFDEDGKGGPLSLNIADMNGKVHNLGITDGEVIMPPGKIPLLESKVTVFKLEPERGVGSYRVSKRVESFSISNGQAFKDGIPVSLPFSIERE